MTASNKNRPAILTQTIRGNHTYHEIWDWQKYLNRKLVEEKRAEIKNRPHYLLLCEHQPVYTLGKSGDIANVKLSKDELDKRAIEFFKINRGGDITYHGPGQITGYLIFDLDDFYHDLHRFVRDIEQSVIKTIAHYGLKGERIDGYTGVWLDKGSEDQRKICAIGIHMSRWVSLHGFALNVNTDLSYFDNIIPCGIEEDDKSVTSISNEIGREASMDEVMNLLKKNIGEVFGAEIVDSVV